MPPEFAPPLSTSNLYAPAPDHLWSILEAGWDEHGNWRTGHLVQLLESQLCQYHDSPYCVAFATGFWALVAAVRIRALPDRGKVIIPSMTYRRLADVVYWTGKEPMIVDIDAETLAMCPASVESTIDDETALILGVHPIVNCCDVDRLLGIAERHHVPIVIDAVESVHETIAGRRVGSFGVGEVFSFHASKLINGCEGGYVCTDDPSFREALIRFREHSPQMATTDDAIGLNAVLSDGHAAFALAGLDELDRNVEHNRTIYEMYVRQLRDVPHLRLLRFDEREQTSFKNIVAEVQDTSPINRDGLVTALNEVGILARAHYWPALHAKDYAYAISIGDVPQSESAMQRYINLPCGQRVSTDDVFATCQLLNDLLCQRTSAASSP